MSEEQTIAPREAFQSAYLEWQKGMPRIDKMRQGHHYRYVGLSELLQACLPVLTANGLTLHHQTGVRDGQFIVRAVLAHTSGESVSTEYPIDLASVQEAVGAVKKGPKGERRESMNAIQAQGSALTYARRYTTMCVLGITDGLDFDAADVATPAAPGPWDDECAEWESKIEDADDLASSRKLWAEATQKMNAVVEKTGPHWDGYNARLLAAGQACKLRLEGNGEVPW